MNDYYVYGHYRSKDNSLFYIGKGRRDRKDSKQYRPKEWDLEIENTEWYSKVLFDNLSEKEALDIEHKLVSENIQILTNKSVPKFVKEVPNFNEIFIYDENSPSGLYWKKDNVGVNGRVYNKSGTTVGSVKCVENSDRKCWKVVVDKQKFYVHRIVYSMFNELPTDLVIDHIDGDALNNRIENLRAVPQKINSRNLSKSRSNKSGVVGVYCREVKRKNKTYKIYLAVCNHDGFRHFKEFFVSKYGEEEAFRLACEWRKQKIEELNAQGAGYTDRHGT